MPVGSFGRSARAAAIGLASIVLVSILGLVLVLILILAPVFPAAAQDAGYPTHPVRMLAASAAGGNPDVLARLLSARLSEIFNNPFVVEDVAGVGGVIAAKQTAAAPPDGYTLVAQRFRLSRASASR